MKAYSELLRVHQWYKNMLIFLPLLFAAPEQHHSLTLLIAGFFGLCAISSVTYMINDWVDRKADRLHPVKKHRPLASGKTTGKQAILAGILLIGIAGMAAWILGGFYGTAVGIYFVLTNAYSFGLKNRPVVDLILIAGNFALRALAGMTSLPDQNTLPYFILIFSVIFIFLTHKRRSDIKFLDKKAVLHKPVLHFYTKRNAYLIRLMGYAGVLSADLMLLNQGVGWIHLGPALGWLILTSILFSKNPELTLKPHRLFQQWTWDIALMVTVAGWLL